jgi:uncharacterized RDD family membrane protein YckC
MTTNTQRHDLPGEWLFRLLAFGVMYGLIGLVSGPFIFGFRIVAASSESDTTSMVAFLLSLGCPLLAWILLMIVPLSRTGQTPGMRWFGLKMVRVDNGEARVGQLLVRGRPSIGA